MQRQGMAVSLTALFFLVPLRAFGASKRRCLYHDGRRMRTQMRDMIRLLPSDLIASIFFLLMVIGTIAQAQGTHDDPGHSNGHEHPVG
jgi:hypothetical protein